MSTIDSLKLECLSAITVLLFEPKVNMTDVFTNVRTFIAVNERLIKYYHQINEKHNIIQVGLFKLPDSHARLPSRVQTELDQKPRNWADRERRTKPTVRHRC